MWAVLTTDLRLFHIYKSIPLPRPQCTPLGKRGTLSGKPSPNVVSHMRLAQRKEEEKASVNIGVKVTSTYTARQPRATPVKQSETSSHNPPITPAGSFGGHVKVPTEVKAEREGGVSARSSSQSQARADGRTQRCLLWIKDKKGGSSAALTLKSRWTRYEPDSRRKVGATARMYRTHGKCRGRLGRRWSKCIPQQ